MMRDGSTLLHTATESFGGDIDSVKILLEQDDSNINIRNLEGETPLHLAIKNQRCSVELIELLVVHGADVKAATPRDGNTPLHWVAIGSMNKGMFIRKRCRIIEILVKHGCDVNARNLEGRIPLHFASEKEYYLLVSETEGLIEVLLKYESDANAIDSKGDTPFHLYLQNNQMSYERVRMFLEKAGDSNFANAKGDTPLHLAVLNNRLNFSIFGVFLDHGADVNKRNAMGENVLQAYCNGVEKDDRMDDMLVLLQSEEEQLKNSSALHVACLHHRFDEVRELLRLGADVNAVDQLFGHSPLAYVSIGSRCTCEIVDSRSIAKLMLDYGANIDDIGIVEYRDGLYAYQIRVRLMDEHGKICSPRTILFQHMAKILAMQEKLVERDTNEELPISLWNRKNWRIPKMTHKKRGLYDYWFSRSSKELEAMSETKLAESGKTFLNVLLAKTAAPYAKNKELVEAFLAKKAMFPIYEGMLDAQLMRDIYRRRLLDSAAVFLSDALEFADPSDEFYERTLSYCSNEDLQRIIGGSV